MDEYLTCCIIICVIILLVILYLLINNRGNSKEYFAKALLRHDSFIIKGKKPPVMNNFNAKFCDKNVNTPISNIVKSYNQLLKICPDFDLLINSNVTNEKKIIKLNEILSNLDQGKNTTDYLYLIGEPLSVKFKYFARKCTSNKINMLVGTIVTSYERLMKLCPKFDILVSSPENSKQIKNLF